MTLFISLVMFIPRTWSIRDERGAEHVYVS
jgi:hypothetical protein